MSAATPRLARRRAPAQARRPSGSTDADADADVEALVAQRTAALRDALDRSQAEARAAREFLATMSHEIRTPLNGVIGMIELLQGTRLDGEQRGYVDTLLGSADTLLAVIDDVLELSRIDGGGIGLERRTFSPLRVAQDALAMLRPHAEHKGLALMLWAEPLPDALTGDPTRLQQAWLNLLSDAIRRTERGEVRMTLAAERMRDGRWALRGTVQDTGVGATEGPRAVQASTPAPAGRAAGGSALGPTIGARLLARMDGSLTIDEPPGGGARFVFIAMLDAPADADSPPKADAPSLATLRVLLAEDNPVNQSLALAVLARFGIEATLARDGREALAAIRAAPFDVVLMDVRMPGMDGLEATRAIRALPASGPRPWIVAVTADAFEADRERCLEAGMDDFVAKPFRQDALRAALERAHACRTTLAG